MPTGPGGRRKKRRTHVAPPDGSQTDPSVPRSMVFRRGKVPQVLRELVGELRAVMQPHTAMRLQERARADLRDYLDVASELGVSHFLMLSASDAGANLRLTRVPRGPTLTFRLRAYSLVADVKRTQRRPVQLPALDVQQPPLLILNNFGDDSADQGRNAAPADGAGSGSGSAKAGRGRRKTPEHVELMATMFQNMFPPLDVASARVSSSVRRCVLLDWQPETNTVEWRNYAIRTVPVGLSRAVRKIVERSGRRGGALPLSSLDDISEALLGNPALAGAESSESEGEGAPETHVDTGPVSAHGAGSGDDAASGEAAADAPAPDPRQQRGYRQQLRRARMRHTPLPPTTGTNAASRRASGADSAGGGGGGGGSSSKRAVRLTEIGPRLSMQLVKVEEGLCRGEVLFHSYIHKSRAEADTLKRRARERDRIKRRRREAQEENVRAKRARHAGDADAAPDGADGADGDESDGGQAAEP